MINPIDTLIELNEITEALDVVQHAVDVARVYNQQDQGMQLELDRKQTEIDARREFVQLAKLDISSRN